MALAWHRKLQRESARITRQIRFAVQQAPFDLYARYFKDRAHSLAKFEVLAPPSGALIAILVVYQPRGVPQSVFAMLAHLRSRGFDVLLASNGFLSAHDHAALAPHCAAILQRPNIGYDFGAYQHALRMMREQGWTPDELLLINDSIFYPLFADDDLIERMRASGAGFTGTVLNASPKAASAHLGSYMLLFRRDVVESAAFTGFWRDYMPWTNRNHAIKRGEVRLTQTMIEAGITPHAVYSQQALVEALAALPPAQVLHALEMRIVRGYGFVSQAYCNALAGYDGSEAWRGRVLSELEAEMAQNNQAHMAASLYPVFLGASFLKKDIMRIPEFRERICKDMSACKQPVLSSVLDEIATY